MARTVETPAISSPGETFLTLSIELWHRRNFLLAELHIHMELAQAYPSNDATALLHGPMPS